MTSTADPTSTTRAAAIPTAEHPVIDITAAQKIYGMGDATVHALRRVDLRIERGGCVAIMGASGSGKSTLMNVIGCLDVLTHGRYRFDGIDVAGLTSSQLALVRNRKIGFIFQSFNLIPRTSALANVELPLAYAGMRAGLRRRRARAALELVGLEDRLDHEPNKLSGGQQQRVAVARALVTGPALILADEPTGNLDSHATAEVLRILDQLSAGGRTVVIITHEDEVADHAQRIVRLRDGQIISDQFQNPTRSADRALRRNRDDDPATVPASTGGSTAPGAR
jgi:putative ABC transport system ATP-binding protein